MVTKLLARTTKINWEVILNFAAVYLVWGSTYLAIKYAIVSFPPLLMACSRFLLASGLMFSIGKLRGEQRLLSADKKIAAKSGLLLVMGNGLVCLAETSIPSGLTAIIIGTSPISIMLLNWFWFERSVPTFAQVAGVLISLVGIIFLTKGETHGTSEHHVLGVIALAIAVVSWSVGSLMQRRAGKLPNIFTFSGYQLFIGSFLVGILGIATGELKTFDASKITNEAIFAFFYLVLFGSALAFSSYIWLSRNVEPAKVATYAVVNPVVAVWLGWMIAGEQVNFSTMTFSFLVLIGLFLVIFAKPSDKKMAPVKNQSQAVK
jgi:drug/metabolite transporter (DMT)-like permease